MVGRLGVDGGPILVIDGPLGAGDGGLPMLTCLACGVTHEAAQAHLCGNGEGWDPEGVVVCGQCGDEVVPAAPGHLGAAHLSGCVPPVVVPW